MYSAERKPSETFEEAVNPRTWQDSLEKWIALMRQASRPNWERRAVRADIMEMMG